MQNSLNTSLHSKLLKARQEVFRNNEALGIYTAWHLATDILFDLAHATKDNALPRGCCDQYHRMGKKKIIAEVIHTAEKKLAANKQRFKVPERTPGSFTDEETALRKCVYRLTRAEICMEYGFDPWWSTYETHTTCDDVVYGEFLRTHGLTNYHGADVTRADLPPLQGDSVFDRREGWRRTETLAAL